MPELPEVEVVCRGLLTSILNDKITSILVRCYNLRHKIPQNLNSVVENTKIIDITRRAKYILINLDNNIALIIHLGMTGNLVVHQHQRDSFNKHDHVIFYLESGKELVYHDVRRFGLIKTCNIDQLDDLSLFADNGPEPLTQAFNAKYLYDSLRHKSSGVKQAIMSNNIVVGIGNIYACEILFRSRINPFREAKDITINEAEEIVNHTRSVLMSAIDAGGSSFSDYLNASGDRGYFQHNFQVYQRQDCSCVNCLHPIMRAKQQGRSSFFCPNCQL